MPIIPDYLCTLDANTTANAEKDENGRVGLLLSSKALVQLILNPAVGTLTGTLGYARPLFLGNLSLLLAALRKLHTTFIRIRVFIRRVIGVFSRIHFKRDVIKIKFLIDYIIIDSSNVINISIEF